MKHFTLEEISKKMSGNISIVVMDQRYGLDIEAYTTKTIIVGKINARTGVCETIAFIFRHYCGEVVVHTPDHISLSLDTMEKNIVPIMQNFDTIVNSCS